MTRILGPERVPAGFTITTEACVAYMEAGGQEPEGMDEQVAEALARLEEAAGKRAGRPRGPAARLGALGRARIHAGHARHGAQPGPQRRAPSRVWPRGPATSASPGTPTGASCRCSPTWSTASRRAHRGGDQAHQGRARASSSTPSSTSTRCASSTERFKAIYREQTGEEFPQEPREQLGDAIRAVFDSWSGDRAVAVPAHQPHPRRVGHRGQRAADGLRQQGRDLGLGRRLQP